MILMDMQPVTRYLKIFAGFLKEQFRATDIIGRVGGDEFMILMKNVRLDYGIHLHLQSSIQIFKI